VNRAYSDWTMELHRKLNPDWRFSDPTAFLLAEIATIESSRRYFELAGRMGSDEVPQEYWPARYGPKASVEPQPEVQDTSKALDAATDLRADLFA